MTGVRLLDPVPARAADLDAVALRDPVFIADLHLSEAQPATLARFLRFAREVAATHRELVILGDLFEFWAGDDDLDSGIGRTVAEALQALDKRGVAVFLMQGNRDLLLGRGFAQAARATLLADPTVAELSGRRILLAHGDVYCTRDVDYQSFRARVRNPDWQRDFLSRPLAERRALVGAVRAVSEAGKRIKAMDITDVTPEAIDAALRAAGLAAMIHGHTHRPAVHRWTLDGCAVERWVLPDWDFDDSVARGGYFDCRAGALRAVALDP